MTPLDAAKECLEADCLLPARTAGRCPAHYQRYRLGKPASGVKRRRDPRDQRIHWGDGADVGLSGAHSRVTRLWGAASRYACVECSGAAAQWAYDGADPAQLLGLTSGNPLPMWYSAYPEFYMPMCRRCHKKRDNAMRIEELRKYRYMKKERGL